MVGRRPKVRRTNKRANRLCFAGPCKANRRPSGWAKLAAAASTACGCGAGRSCGARRGGARNQEAVERQRCRRRSWVQRAGRRGDTDAIVLVALCGRPASAAALQEGEVARQVVRNVRPGPRFGVSEALWGIGGGMRGRSLRQAVLDAGGVGVWVANGHSAAHEARCRSVSVCGGGEREGRNPPADANLRRTCNRHACTNTSASRAPPETSVCDGVTAIMHEGRAQRPHRRIAAAPCGYATKVGLRGRGGRGFSGDGSGIAVRVCGRVGCPAPRVRLGCSATAQRQAGNATLCVWW